jgi:hypothetical protein
MTTPAAGIDSATWSLFVGSFLPPAVAVILQPRWPRWARTVVSAALCLLIGFCTAWFAGDLRGVDIGRAAILTLLASRATYAAFWKPIGAADAIEQATSSASQGTPPASGDG